MDIVGLIFTALVLGCLGLGALFGYLLLTSRRASRRATERWERSGTDRTD
ncbi:hypothetical protein [Microbacterium sp.]|nr:hypothetical protein [Microbacterium sp.]MBN9192333.1 hypothetical protein [Microbacterium sp.]